MRTFADDGFQFGLETVLGATYRGAADVGEVLATASRIRDDDADSWLHEWTATAGASWAAGRAADRDGRRVSALGCYRRAASYYATALHAIARSSEPERRPDIWRRQRECWERVVDLSSPPGERLAIPYEDTTLPAFFFPAPDARPGERRPLVVVNDGSDGATSQAWVAGGAAAAERGWHWMTFDGPGQQAALYEQGIPFRPDWEAVLTPVTDAVVGRPDVEAGNMVVIGVGQAGYWVPRALAFEHRYAAAVADPGVVDVSAAWTASLPSALRRDLAAGNRSAFDRNMRLAEVFSSDTRTMLSARGAPYGIEEGSRYDLFKAVGAYRLGDEVRQIATPMLITDPEDEQFWPGQSLELYTRLPGPAELVRFTADEGANRHREPLASATRDARIFDWIEGHLSRPCADAGGADPPPRPRQANR